MKKQTSRRGFTLIELMVAISIISMLSSVVLASLNGARAKSKNGRIQEEVVSLRNQIETSWNGTTYNDLSSDLPGVSGTSVAIFDVGFGVSTQSLGLANDIVRINGASYGDRRLSLSGCVSYCVTNAYAGDACAGITDNSITVFTNNPSVSGTCPTTYSKASKYAIYASYLPNVGASGYFCIDSSGNTSQTTTGGIPSVPGPGPTCN